MHTYAHCPVCNDTHNRRYLTCRDFTVSQAEFDITRCQGCGFKFTNPVPTIEQIGAYYQSEDYVSHSDSRKGLVNFLYQTVRAYTLKQKVKFVRQQSGLKTGALLDIGCGTADFLKQAHTAGWQTTGLEPSDAARRVAKDKNGLSLLLPQELYNLPAQSFDVVTLWHVLEHLHHLNEDIEQMGRVLKPNGTLIIAVPNCDSLDAQTYAEYWAAYDVPRHLYHFTPQSMERLMQKHGFRVVHKQLMPFDAYYVSLLSEKYKTGGLLLLSAFLNGWRSNAKARADVNYGSSIIYVLKR